MEYNKYYIKRKDTLKSIADELGLSVEALRGYHNRYCELDDLIGGDGKNLTKVGYILIPDSEKELKRKKIHQKIINTFSLVQQSTGTLKYDIIQNVDMQVSGSSIIDSETEILWECKKEGKEDSFYVDLYQKSHQIKYIKSIYRPLTEYMQKFNKPLEYIRLRLGPGGDIREIKNQKEIEHQWLELKKSLMPEMGDTLEEKQMLEGGDKDFANTFPLLKNNLLYRLFFMDLYKSYTVSDKFYNVDPLEYVSQIFAQEKLFLDTKQKIEKDDYLLKIKFYSEADFQKNEHLKNIYDTKLRDFLKEELNYQFTWSLEYTFDIRQGLLLLCHSKIKEQTGSNYKHFTEHKISLTENAESL